MIGKQWGVSEQEVVRRYPCDILVHAPVQELWRGVTVQKPAAQLWPWLCQLQLAPYSYDWLDNLGRRSPGELRGLPDPRPGDPFSRVAGRFSVGRILSVSREEHLTASVMGAVMSYVLVPEGSTTRLLMKVVFKHRHWYVPALAIGDWLMARRQLLNLKGLAERNWPPSSLPSTTTA